MSDQELYKLAADSLTAELRMRFGKTNIAVTTIRWVDPQANVVEVKVVEYLGSGSSREFRPVWIRVDRRPNESIFSVMVQHQITTKWPADWPNQSEGVF